MKRVLSLVRRCIDTYHMIEPGDRIAVGVSGGKDSVALLCALARLRAFYPYPFELEAVTMDPCFHGAETDYSEIASLCHQLNVPYTVKRTQLYQVVFVDRAEKNPCSLCAKMRRGILHDTALELGCNKIALGHHFDDAVETFIMNLMIGGHLGCYSPTSYLSRKNLTLIRPLSLTPESNIASAIKQEKLPVVKSICPADKTTKREEAKLLLSTLETQFPALKQRLMGAMVRGNLDGWGEGSSLDALLD